MSQVWKGRWPTRVWNRDVTEFICSLNNILNPTCLSLRQPWVKIWPIPEQDQKPWSVLQYKWLVSPVSCWPHGGILVFPFVSFITSSCFFLFGLVLFLTFSPHLPDRPVSLLFYLLNLLCIWCLYSSLKTTAAVVSSTFVTKIPLSISISGWVMSNNNSGCLTKRTITPTHLQSVITFTLLDESYQSKSLWSPFGG